MPTKDSGIKHSVMSQRQMRRKVIAFEELFDLASGSREPFGLTVIHLH